MDALSRAIQLTPIIDNHAHPLLRPGFIGSHDSRAITSEAGGDALAASISSLSHLRGVRQLSSVLRCPPTWEAVEAAMQKARDEPDNAWSKFCLRGIETVLIDDGLDGPQQVFPVHWHSALTRSDCKQILRIEQLAQNIMINTFKSRMTPQEAWREVKSEFEDNIRIAIADPTIVGFKSVICYRGGLNIPPPVVDDEILEEKAAEMIERLRTASDKRIRHPLIGPWLVHRTSQLIRDSDAAHKKPLQFHTGLGDNDIRLALANPAYMQNYIEMYPTVPIVLLHASYPFTQEAGYLATHYSNVYLDIGEVFPFVSRDGQERVIREALELCPSEKMLYSTDGHWFPETYLLAVMQAREALDVVLPEYVRKGHLSEPQAVKVVEDFFFHTSNKIYNLGLKLKPLDAAELPSLGDSATAGNTAKVLDFFDTHREVKFLRLQWVDYTATPRLRVVPKKQVLKMLPDGVKANITVAGLALLQEDQFMPKGSVIDEYTLTPCFDSLRLSARGGYASVECEIRKTNGDTLVLCPRSALRRAVDYATVYGISILLGFEIEVVFMSKVVDQTTGAVAYGDKQVTPGHAWSTQRSMQDPAILIMIEEIVETLERSGIDLQMFHPESAPGQFEFILPPDDPLASVSMLLSAREIISTVAEKHGLRATLHPKPFDTAAGTASHVHISATPEHKSPSFFAGILRHLPAILAFTYSNPASYLRAVDGCWAGGTWVTWGTQNKEAALRRIAGAHFELKTMDGLANPYLAMAAVIFAGVQGVASTADLGAWKDCRHDPAQLSAAERAALGITQKLPSSLDAALEALAGDAMLVALMHEELVDWYICTKKAEMEMLSTKTAEEAKRYLIERY